MNLLYPDVARRAAYRCEYCHAPQEMFNTFFEVEHILPRSEGGGDEPENLALSCRACNGFKAARLSAPDPETGQDAPLFHPRHDDWHAHFSVPNSLELTGLTPIGRATVAALRMNSPSQIAARRNWHRLGLFP